MDFFELEAFLELSHTLHFARAAAQVNLSPSALSRLVSRLEEETGVHLLDRDSRAVQLTKDGAAFAAFAQKCLDDRNDLNAGFAHNSERVSGTLRLYASVTACYSILPPFVRQLTAQYPYIQLAVQTGDPADAADAVRESRADLAVAAIPDEGYPGFECIGVKTTPLVFAAATGGRYESISGSPQDIVSSVPLILPKAGLARRRFEKWIRSRNVRPVIAAETEGNEAIMALVQLGIGIGLVPQIVLQNGPYKEGFVCHRAGNALGNYDIGFIQKKEVTGTSATRRVREAASQILHTLQP